ncbi:hypothetical protein HYW67_04325 [Candidatus Parcubacteria bacterium]|nr:hypothetical protein [Candidatus Parcubacteria bacterium]
MAKRQPEASPLRQLLEQFLDTEQLRSVDQILIPWRQAARRRRYPLPAPSTVNTGAVCAAITRATGERAERITAFSVNRALRETSVLTWKCYRWLKGRQGDTNTLPFWDLVDLQLMGLGAGATDGLDEETFDALVERVLESGGNEIYEALMDFADRLSVRFGERAWEGGRGVLTMPELEIDDAPVADLEAIPAELLRRYLGFRMSGARDLALRLEPTVRMLPYYLPLYEQHGEPGNWVVLTA